MSQITKIEDLPLNWGEEVEPEETEIICGVDDNECVIFESNEQSHSNAAYHQSESMANNNIIYSDDVVNENNVIYMPQTSQGFVNNSASTSNSHQVVEYQFPDQEYLDIQVTEEVVSGAWDHGQEGVDNYNIPGDVKLVLNHHLWEDEVEIPLPQDQDSYAASRPFPCDFCSRRFSKKANLMNHMVCHQVDRPHLCNLCGTRYRRKAELITHMKIHAYVPEKETVSEDDDEDNEIDDIELPMIEHKKRTKNKSKRGRKSLNHPKYNNENYMNNNSKNFKFSKKHYSNMSSHPSVKIDIDPLEIPETSTSENFTPRWPITDPHRPYVCQHCGVGFQREKALISHSRVHLGDSPLECNTCGESFWDINMLRDHSQSKHGVQISINNVNETQDEEEYYPNEEHSEEYSDFHCDICGNMFHRWDALKRHRRSHMKTEPIEVAPYSCEICDENFSAQEDFLSHMESHPENETNRCMICGECFLDATTLTQHVRKRHLQDLPAYACTFCGKRCKDKRSLQQHLLVHSADKIFTCMTCLKRFHSRARLKRHMMSHRDKIVACDECGKEFPDGRALLNHRHSHNKDHSRQFNCFHCDKSFGSRSSQQIHARIHTGERPYGCRFCWKAFADGGTLRKHERIHTGEKPYACPICPRAFNQRVVLREHIRSHHSGPDIGSSSHSIFICKVCSETFNHSNDLVLHLIAHSDENTAKHRTPRTGQRKYKRRRRLNTHELSLLSETLDQDDTFPNDFNDTYASNNHNDRMDDFDDSDIDYGKKKTKRKYKSRTSRQNVSDNFESVVKSFESVMQNFNSIVDSSKSEARKAKLKRKNHRMKKNEHLQYEEKPFMSPQSSSPPQTKVSPLASGGFIKRPSGEGRIRPRTKNVTLSTLAALKAVNVISPRDPSADFIIRGGPRTKNVNYHNVKLVKLEPATFEDYEQPLLKSPSPPIATPPPDISPKIVTSEQKLPFIGKVEVEDSEVEVSTEDPLNNLEQSNHLLISEYNQIQRDSNDTNLKPNEVMTVENKSKTQTSSHSLVEPEYRCDMCSEIFTERSALVFHVNIHI